MGSVVRNRGGALRPGPSELSHAPWSNRSSAACPGRDVLDVGCGTGISISAVPSRPEPTSSESRWMHEWPSWRHGAGSRSRWRRSRSWDPAGRTVRRGGGRAGLALDRRRRRGRPRRRRCCGPSGCVALFWNVFAAAIRRRARPSRESTGVCSPGPLAAMWDRAGLGWRYAALSDQGRQRHPSAADRSVPTSKWRYGWERSYSRDEWLDQMPTFGGYGQLPARAA